MTGRRPLPGKRLAVMFAAAAILLNFDAAFACTTKSKAYTTALKSDLRNLVSAQEAFFSDSQRFTNDLEALGFRKSTGVAAITFDEIAKGGWSATATHTQTPRVCHIFVGPRPPGTPESIEAGQPWCEEDAEIRSERLGEALGLPTLLFLLVTSLVTARFLSKPRGANWPTWGLTLLTLVYIAAILVMGQCGSIPFGFVGSFLVLGLGLLGLAVRRRVVEA